MNRLVQQGVAYGCAGLLVETFFTGIKQLVLGNPHLTTTSYLWMLPIYSVGGLLYDWLLKKTGWSQLQMAAAYLPLIYAQEFLWGLLFKFTVGVPWFYGHHWWTPMGLVNLAYAPLWFCLGYLFQPGRLLFRRWSALR